jgi:hypothetical protein
MGQPLTAAYALTKDNKPMSSKADAVRPLIKRANARSKQSLGGGASKAQPRNVVSAASEEPKTILRRGVKKSG